MITWWLALIIAVVVILTSPFWLVCVIVFLAAITEMWQSFLKLFKRRKK